MTVCCMHPCWCCLQFGNQKSLQDSAGLNTNSEISLLDSSGMAVIVSCASRPPCRTLFISGKALCSKPKTKTHGFLIELYKGSHSFNFLSHFSIGKNLGSVISSRSYNFLMV